MHNRIKFYKYTVLTRVICKMETLVNCFHTIKVTKTVIL